MDCRVVKDTDKCNEGERKIVSWLTIRPKKPKETLATHIIDSIGMVFVDIHYMGKPAGADSYISKRGKGKCGKKSPYCDTITNGEAHVEAFYPLLPGQIRYRKTECCKCGEAE